MWAFEKGINDGPERKNDDGLQNGNGLPGVTKAAAGRLSEAEGFFIIGASSDSCSGNLETVATERIQ